MIEKHHQKGDAQSTALYSDCLSYRYSLRRVWDLNGKRVHFVMLNPSTATEVQNDPTVERCERRARALGYGAFCVTNIFAWRETDPKKMRAVPDPIGAYNDEAISKASRWADLTIAAWGTHGAHLDRGAQVKRLLATLKAPVFHLGLSKEGHPKHPLYIAYQQLPEPWEF
ncbi:MAG: DUF1643 domain-containing protein [Paracoccaceae bacterium]|jgi:hypothetical protein